MKVYQAINAVQRALAAEGISKGRRNQQQGYNFRGIDDVYNVVSPLLGKNGLCVLPRILSRECVERQTAKGGTLFYVTVDAEFDFIASEDGSKHTVKTFGEAMDSADKATNKAMSAAYKYAVMQAFAIPTEGDNDADANTHEVAPAGMDAKKVRTVLARIAGETDVESLSSLAKESTAEAREAGDKIAYDAIRNAAMKRHEELTKEAA